MIDHFNIAHEFGGGGVAAHIASSVNNSIITFGNCTIYNNIAHQYAGGEVQLR